MTAVDTFTTVDDTDTVTHDFKRDRWGRPNIKQPNGKHKGYTRCSSAAKTIEDTFNLEKWARRNAIYGMAYDNSLVARMLAIGGDPSTWQKPDKDAVNTIVEAAENVAKAHKAADIGTAVHRLTERLDRGEDVKSGPYQADLDAYRKALTAAGLTVDPRYIECRIVNDQLEMAGTADRILKTADYRWVIADLKTSATVDYGGLGWAAQLAAYAGGDLYDVDAEERVNTPDMDRQVGLIIHLPAGQGVCTIYEVDIAAGLGAAHLANDIRTTRKAAKQWITPHVKAIADPTDDRRTALLARYRLFNDDDKRRFLALGVDHDDLNAVQAALDAVDPFNKVSTPVATCRSCNASIIWALTKNDKRIPLDVEPTAGGNLMLVDGVARAPKIDDDVPFLQYVSHFATCPNANQHRKPPPPDEGHPVDDNDFLALSIAYANLNDHAQAWLKALIIEGSEAGVDWRAQHHHTLRRYELYRGLIALAAAGPDWGNDDTVTDIIAIYNPVNDTPVGALLGHLNARQAADFAQQVDHYLALPTSA